MKLFSNAQYSLDRHHCKIASNTYIVFLKVYQQMHYKDKHSLTIITLHNLYLKDDLFVNPTSIYSASSTLILSWTRKQYLTLRWLHAHICVISWCTIPYVVKKAR